MNIFSRHFLKSAGLAALALACGITVASAQAVVIERGVMPEPRVEVIPAPPGEGYNWYGRCIPRPDLPQKSDVG